LPCGFVLDRRYRIREYLTSGGMANIYRVSDNRLDREFALKEMSDNFRLPEDREMAVARFMREAEILAGLSHPSIPRVIDHFVDGNRYYLIMDLIVGKDLETMLDEEPEKRFSQEKVIEWLWQILDVLKYLHSLSPPVIYRDLKPSNIMIGDNGKLYLIDFGIARVLEPEKKGTLIGTPGYSPPEQYKGCVEASSDIYALGATLHHILTGRDPREEIPFSFPPIKEMVKDIDDSLAQAIDGSLEYDMGRRIADTTEFIKILSGSKIVGQEHKYLSEGMLLMESGKSMEAEEAFSKLLLVNPKNSQAYLKRGLARKASGKLSEAIEDFRRAADLDGENTDALYNIGITLKEKGDLVGAESAFLDLLNVDSGHFKALNGLGEVYFLQKSWERAISAFRKALLVNSSFEPARANLEEAETQKAIDDRLKWFDRVHSDSSDPLKAFYNLAMYFMEWGRFEEAEAEFKKAIKVNPGDPDAYEGLGYLCLKKGDLEAARGWFRKTLDIAPERYRLYLGISSSFRKAGEPDMAMEAIKAGIWKILIKDDGWTKKPEFISLASEFVRLADILKIAPPGLEDLRRSLKTGKNLKDVFLKFWKKEGRKVENGERQI